MPSVPFPVRNLNGRIDEFLIDQLPLSPDEMATLHNWGNSIDENPTTTVRNIRFRISISSSIASYFLDIAPTSLRWDCGFRVHVQAAI